MTPYYEQDGITIYHGDCREVMEQWEGLRTQPFDLLLTDPPYGLNEAAGKNKSRGKPSPGLHGGSVGGPLFLAGIITIYHRRVVGSCGTRTTGPVISQIAN